VKGVWIVVKKLHPYPDSSNTRYGTKERKIGCKNSTLKIEEKKDENLRCLRVL